MRVTVRQSGFTLVELMIVVLIVAILAAIAVPSYQSYVMRSYRASARACMSEYAQFMERAYTTNMTYVGGAPAAPLGCATESNMATRYGFSVTGIAARTYTVNAIPVTNSVQARQDTKCATLTLDQAGTRDRTGTGTVAECW